jgi:argininosuccinate lyase
MPLKPVKSSYVKSDGCDPLLIILEKYRLKTVGDEQIKKIKINAKLATTMKLSRLNYIRQAKNKRVVKKLNQLTKDSCRGCLKNK